MQNSAPSRSQNPGTGAAIEKFYRLRRKVAGEPRAAVWAPPLVRFNGQNWARCVATCARRLAAKPAAGGRVGARTGEIMRARQSATRVSVEVRSWSGAEAPVLRSPLLTFHPLSLTVANK